MLNSRFLFPVLALASTAMSARVTLKEKKRNMVVNSKSRHHYHVLAEISHKKTNFW